MADELTPEIRELLAQKNEADAKRHQLESELHKHFAAMDEIDAKLLRAGVSAPGVLSW